MKKYQITERWEHTKSSYNEGSSYFETVEELIRAYETKSEQTEVKRIGLSYQLLNSLPFESRREVENKENLLIMAAFKEAGHDIFIMTTEGFIYLK